MPGHYGHSSKGGKKKPKPKKKGTKVNEKESN